MARNHLRAAWLLVLSACSAHPTRTTATSANAPATEASSAASAAAPAQNVTALFARELDALPPSVAVSGRGWSAQVPGRNPTVKNGSTEGTEELDFAFEGTGPVECIVFSEAFDPGSYVGNIVEELKKSLEVVNFTPTRFTVEQEIPAYFTSIFYRKKTEKGVLAGQLKLALGLHLTRPVVCLHDVPGYTTTFESVTRAMFANYRVADAPPPLAVTIGVARIGTMPIGITRETASLLEDGRTQFTTISTQIVPRSANELMISDEAEVAFVAKSKLVEAHFIQGDLHGEKMNLILKAGTGNKYQVSGTLGQNKPLKATITTKHGLPSPAATSLRLKQEMAKAKSFRFIEPEYHPALDPTNIMDVSYTRTQADKPKLVRVGLGQLELLATVDDEGEQLQTEMKAGSQTIIFERVYHRDDRKDQTKGHDTNTNTNTSQALTPKKAAALKP